MEKEVDLGLGGWSHRDEDDPLDNRGKVMAEFADMAVDDIVNGEYGMWCPPERKTIKCNKCGSTRVHWSQVPSGKWCLYTNDKPHVCEPVRRTGKNSNKKELTGYKLVVVNRCETCDWFDGDDRCNKHDYSVVSCGICKDWESDT